MAAAAPHRAVPSAAPPQPTARARLTALRRIKADVRFDRAKCGSGLKISEEGRVLECASSGGTGGLAVEGFDSGVHTWSIKWERGDRVAYVGVFQDTMNLGRDLGRTNDSWGWYLADNKFVIDGKWTSNSNPKIQVGQTLHVRLDCDARTLEFASADGRFAKAFDLPAGVKLYPAASLSRGNACRLV